MVLIGWVIRNRYGIVKKIGLLFLLAICFGLSAWFGLRFYLIKDAERIAGGILEGISIEEDGRWLVDVTKKVHAAFEHQSGAQILWYRIRPHITNDRLPGGIRMPEGVVETIVQAGDCDNASRMLAFVLRQKGIESVQWNMVTPSTAHSARLVEMSGGGIAFVDPFFGAVATDSNGLPIDFETAQLKYSAGYTLGDLFTSLSPRSDLNFYKNMNEMFASRQGQALVISTELPSVEEREVFYLGAIDGSEVDVVDASGRLGMTPYWHYIGHRYDRSWVRELQAQQDIDLQIILTEKPDSRVLTAIPMPEIDGKVLSWKLQSGDKVRFEDGRAGISWSRLNSYQPIDQIVIKSVKAN